jgi:uncharacterized protein YdhG (YjbR/CyaY superfamily)
VSHQATLESVDAYIATFPKDVQPILEKVRLTIARAVPGAEEAISYRVPTFRLNGNYPIYFAGFKRHIGLYPVHTDSGEFDKAVPRYASAKATLRFSARPADPVRPDHEGREGEGQ